MVISKKIDNIVQRLKYILGSSLICLTMSCSWNNTTNQLVEKVTRSSPPKEFKRVSIENFDQLPAPVAKYLGLVLKEEQPLIQSAQITQSGEFNMSRTGENWKAFEAKHYASIQPPGFVWDASIHIAPLMNVRVRDSYLAGQSSMVGKIFSLITVVDAQNSLELSTSELQRYLAEAVWYPTALIPSESLKWSEIDSTRALATLTDSGITISLEFHFNEAGEATGVFTQERYYEEDGKYKLETWRGYHSKYQEINGMRIPLEGEVEWQLPSGRLPYWKGRIINVEYDFVK